MAAREALYSLVDALPERDLPTVARILEALSLTADPGWRSHLARKDPARSRSPNSVRLDEYLVQALEIGPAPIFPIPQSEYRLTLRIERP